MHGFIRRGDGRKEEGAQHSDEKETHGRKRKGLERVRLKRGFAGRGEGL